MARITKVTNKVPSFLRTYINRYTSSRVPDASIGLKLPGCSRGKAPSKDWRVSTTMVQTYFAMKGPGTDMEDPLVKWIGRQELHRQENGEPT